jgi:hypothetical protein
MRYLLFIIITTLGLMAGKPARLEAPAHDKKQTIISALSQPTSYAEHVQVARVLTTTFPRRDHRALDDCYLPAQLALYYTCPVHTPITNKQPTHLIQQRLLLLFPQHYFW